MFKLHSVIDNGPIYSVARKGKNSSTKLATLNIMINIIINNGLVELLFQGGIKAVVWTDALQMVILLGGLVTIAALGSAKLGGGSVVWNAASLDGRINFNE